MEILNLLEERVHHLINELEKVREDNRRILQETHTQVEELQEQLHALKEENQSLNDSLVQERDAKDNIASRIDVLLERMKSLD